MGFAVIAGINVLEFVKMPEVPEVINAKAPPCTFTFRSTHVTIILVFVASSSLIFSSSFLILLGTSGM